MPKLRRVEPDDHTHVLGLNEANVVKLAPMDEARLLELDKVADRFDVIDMDGEFGGFVITFALMLQRLVWCEQIAPDLDVFGAHAEAKRHRLDDGRLIRGHRHLSTGIDGGGVDLLLRASRGHRQAARWPRRSARGCSIARSCKAEAGWA